MNNDESKYKGDVSPYDLGLLSDEEKRNGPQSESPAIGDPNDGSAKPSEQAVGLERLAHKIAGIVLIINAIVIVLELVLMSDEGGSAGTSISGVVAGVVIGVMLLTGHPKGLIWARIAVVIGAVAFTAMPLIGGDLITAIFQLAFSGSLMLLLFGSPKKGRIITSLAIIGPWLLIVIVGFVAELTGINYLGAAIGDASYDLQELPNNTLNGKSAEYTVTFPPSENWRQLNQQQLSETNPVADTWVMDSGRDAHVLVIVEEGEPDLDTWADAVIDHASSAASKFEVVHRSATQTNLGLEGKIVETSSIIDGMAIKHRFGLFVSGGRAYQVVCFTGHEQFGRLEASFSTIISSFVPAPDVTTAGTDKP